MISKIKGKIKGTWHIKNFLINDKRGELIKIYDEKLFNKLKIKFNINWKQILISKTRKKNTIRGLFYQSHLIPEGKMISCIKGSVFWIAVDLREKSKSFGKWESSFLKEKDNKAFLVSEGFANGCLTLENNTELLLLGNNNHLSTKGINLDWKDEDLNINWPKIHGKKINLNKTISFAEFKLKIKNLNE